MHADPHKGNLLKTSDGKLAFIDFGMMSDISEYERYGLIGLVIGLQNKDLSLVTENLLEVSVNMLLIIKLTNDTLSFRVKLIVNRCHCFVIYSSVS